LTRKVVGVQASCAASVEASGLFPMSALSVGVNPSFSPQGLNGTGLLSSGWLAEIQRFKLSLYNSKVGSCYPADAWALARTRRNSHLST
jgi:hypothetical protein